MKAPTEEIEGLRKTTKRALWNEGLGAGGGRLALIFVIKWVGGRFYPQEMGRARGLNDGGT